MFIIEFLPTENCQSHANVCAQVSLDPVPAFASIKSFSFWSLQQLKHLLQVVQNLHRKMLQVEQKFSEVTGYELELCNAYDQDALQSYPFYKPAKIARRLSTW